MFGQGRFFHHLQKDHQMKVMNSYLMIAHNPSEFHEGYFQLPQNAGG